MASSYSLPSGLGHSPEPVPAPEPLWEPQHGLGHSIALHCSSKSAARASCSAKVPSCFLRLSLKIQLVLQPFSYILWMKQCALSLCTMYLPSTLANSSRLSTPQASSSCSSPEMRHPTKAICNLSAGWLSQCLEPQHHAPSASLPTPSASSSQSPPLSADPFPITFPGCCPLQLLTPHPPSTLGASQSPLPT